MKHNIRSCSRMPLGAMGVGGPPNVPPSEPLSHPRPPVAVTGNAKKKRRTNAKGPRMQSLPCPITQDLNVPAENHSVFVRPPQLSGYGDTMVASNPFDDMPPRAPQAGLRPSLPRHMQPQQHQQQMSGPRMMRGMGSMSSMGELSSIMGYNSAGPINPTGNSMNLMEHKSPMNVATNQQSGSMGPMGNLMNRTSPMNNMGPNQQPSMTMMGNSMSCENPIINMGQNQAMGTLNNHASPMSNMGSNQQTPMTMMGNSVSCENPIINMGQNQAMGTLKNHASTMSNMGANQQTPMTMMGNSVSCENSIINMGQNQTMGTLKNHASPMSNMGANQQTPMTMMGNSMGCENSISNVGQNQAMGTRNNHASPMSNMGANQQTPMTMMGNSMGCENSINNMGQNQTMGTLNNCANPMNNMGSNQQTPMTMMNNPMGRMSPIKNTGPNLLQGAIDAINSHLASQANGPQMGNMEQGIMSIINGISGGNQNHGDNGPVKMGATQTGIQNQPLNGPVAVNNPGGSFGPSHSYSHHMGMQMNTGNLGRPANDPVNTINPLAQGNMNTSGPNGMINTNMGGHPINSMTNDLNSGQRNQMGGPSFGSMPGNMFGTVQNRHPLNMGGGTMLNQGYQPRPGIGPRNAAPSNGKVYPPDQHIIFNTQNRNAPPIYLCGSCHKEVNDNDQGIVCESGCNFWFHRNCVGLSEAAFLMLTQAPFAEWVCDNCSKGKNIPPVKFRP